MDPDVAGTIHQKPSQSAYCLIADDRDRRVAIAKKALQMMAHAPAVTHAAGREDDSAAGDARKPSNVMAIGEGLETMLSLRMALPELPLAAALSGNHLAAFEPPDELHRLYVAIDDDDAGRKAAMTLQDRAQSIGIETIPPIQLAAISTTISAITAWRTCGQTCVLNSHRSMSKIFWVR
ncbi:MAG: toprim domain-containing protein [Pseudomonadota bacterium]